MANQGLNACVVELSKDFLRDFPNIGVAWFIYSESLINLSKYKQGEKALLKAIELFNNSKENLEWFYCDLGRLYSDSGKSSKAIDSFQKANEINPDEATFLIYLGLTYLTLEKFSEAEIAFRRATQCKEGQVEEAFYNLGFVKVTQQKYEEALSYFEKALEIDFKYKVAKHTIKDMKKVISLKPI